MNINLKTIRALTPDQMKNMTESELDKAIEFMRKSNRQALNRLRKAPLGKYSPASASAKTLGDFLTGSVEKEIARYLVILTAKRHVLTELIEWRNQKTASVSGWKKHREETAKRLGLSTKRKKKQRGGKQYYSRRIEKKFWEVYEQYSELHPTDVYNNGSPIIMEMIAGIVADNVDMSADEIIKEAERQINEYRKSKNKAKKKNVSDFFDN